MQIDSCLLRRPFFGGFIMFSNRLIPRGFAANQVGEREQCEIEWVQENVSEAE